VLVVAAQHQAHLNGFSPSGKVTSEQEYTDEVVRILRSYGVCATNGLVDEVWVKKNNTQSHHFDIVTSELLVWRKFASKCTPAKFEDD